MEKYLSIGEVVKMKGVSHRALRHYNDIGVLVPAYVNPETGYRYYSKNQMLILDVILLCVAFGIPLKQFKNYVLADGSIDAQSMTHDAQKKALEVQKKLQQNMYFLDSVTQHFEALPHLPKLGQVYSKTLAQRCFLTMDAPKDMGSWSQYWTCMTLLYSICFKNDFSMSVNQGICFVNNDGGMAAKYFVEIKEPEQLNSHMLVVPEATFTCELFEDSGFFEALDKYTAHENFLAGHMLILNDILERKITQKTVPFEVQLMN